MRPISCSRSILLASLLCACGDEVGPPIMMTENEAPTAAIMGPTEVGVGDLVRFDGEGSEDLDGRIETYQWNFGDGTATATQAVAFHAYNELGRFVVELLVIDDRDARATATHSIDVVAEPSNQPPVARIVAPASGDVGVPILFDASGSTDADGTVVSYEWTLGVGGPAAQGVQVSHTFAAEGTYQISLRIADDDGAAATAMHEITIGGGSGNQAPFANAGNDQTVGVGETVSFDGSNSFDPDGSIIQYDWDFGDGQTGQGLQVTHTYNAPNTFVVELTVLDDGGLSATDTASVTVGQGNYDGMYTMEANPSVGQCLTPGDATFVSSTITFTANGTTLTATQPDPENPNAAPIAFSGTITGPDFSLSGNWTDSSSGQHAISINGTFNASGYTGMLTETVSLGGFPLCSLMWNITGTKLN